MTAPTWRPRVKRNSWTSTSTSTPPQQSPNGGMTLLQRKRRRNSATTTCSSAMSVSRAMLVISVVLFFSFGTYFQRRTLQTAGVFSRHPGHGDDSLDHSVPPQKRKYPVLRKQTTEMLQKLNSHSGRNLPTTTITTTATTNTVDPLNNVKQLSKVYTEAQQRENAYLTTTTTTTNSTEATTTTTIHHPELEYAPQRIPGYLHNSPRTLFGFVMRDLTTRIFGSFSHQHNILVVSKDAPSVLTLLDEEQHPASSEEELRRRIHYTVGGSTLLRASFQQPKQTIHAIYDGVDPVIYQPSGGNTDTVETWWKQREENRENNSHQEFSLMMVDSLRSDDILRQSQTFLQQANVKYVVASFGSDLSFKPFGMEAIRTLIRHGYKVQLLSSSHVISDVFRPNADIVADGVPILEQWLEYVTNSKRQPIRGFIFATKGLDLAIPLATEHVEKVTADKISYKQCDPTFAGIRFLPNNRSSSNRNAAAATNNSDLVEITCHDRVLPLPKYKHVTTFANVSTRMDSLWHSHANLEESEAICTRIKNCKALPGSKRKVKKHFYPADVAAGQVACATRILPQKQHHPDDTTQGKKQPNLLILSIDAISRDRFRRSLPQTSYLVEQLNFTSFSAYTAVSNSTGPNQAALYSGRSLQQSKDSTIDDNDENNNQQWLWDKLRQEGGYATLKAENGCVDSSNSNLIQQGEPNVDHGNAFNRMMCFDFQRPNCLGGKQAAVHMLDYATDFVAKYNELKRPWAALLHFVEGQDDSMMPGTLDDVLWKFIMSIYSPEDGARSQSGVDPFHDAWDNTVIMLMSSNGLNYGSYSMTRQGLKERSQPMLHVHLPSSFSTSQQREVLATNSKWYTTPFDVHATLLQVLLQPNQAKMDSSTNPGLSLVQRLPDSRRSCNTTSMIPTEACKLFGQASDGKDHIEITEKMMPSPPSALSFYADVPKQNRNEMDTQQFIRSPSNSPQMFLSGQSCVCATSHRKWHNCSSHPWSSSNRQDDLSMEETFAIVDCGGKIEGQISVDVEVKRNPNIVNRAAVIDKGMSRGEPTSILFIEVDSVSQQYADRHLPKTRELLQRFRIKKSINEETGSSSFDCGNPKWCSADLRHFSPFGGPNSIPNQISTFGGCMVTTGPKENCVNTTEANVGGSSRIICNEANHLAYGLERVNSFLESRTWCRVPDSDSTQSPIEGKTLSPWIFDIARKNGAITLFAEEFCYDDSPYVAQGNIFNLDVDILPHQLFCRITERQIARKGDTIRGPLWKYEGATDPTIPGIDGVHTFPKVNVSLNHIRSMWEAYPDVPKLAYLNALAAHVYSKYPTMALAAEAYDDTLASFLENMLERDDKDTIIVVRSDHGIQAGPNKVDYATQIEALRPWTEILVPKNFPNYDIQNLYDNQHRLVTGPDLYRTLTNLLVQGKPGIMSTPSEWSIDFLNNEVPETRTCAEAKASSDYCIYENERTFTAPNWGTCNLAETDQDFLCPTLTEEFRHSLTRDVRSVFLSRKIEEDVSCRADQSDHTKGPMVNPSLLHMWSEIDDEVSKHPSTRVSGGMFLYPRQTSLITGLLRLLADYKRKSEGEGLVVCETGFGAGHGSATFLEASQDVTLHIFDKFDRPYQPVVLWLLKRRYPNHKISHYAGDSCRLVPQKLIPVFRPPDVGKNDIHCDMLHGSSLCKSDNIDLVERSPCGVLLTTTAMNSLTDNVVYFGPDGQWTSLAKRGCIRDITCYEEEHMKLDRTYIFNKGGATISHKFCFAVTTGKCQKFQGQIGLQEKACQRRMALFTNLQLNLSQLCRAYQVPIPAFE